uniref:Putative E3 ubiquitin-protein ligase LIN ARM-like domain-containing protein n=1 Tax=Aegilops tauschii TaxID=37682 RepID=N1QTR6_AEGTA
MFVIEETPRQPERVLEEGRAADADSSGSVFHECDDGEVRSCSPTPRGESSEPMPPNMLANEAFEPRIEDERGKGAEESTSYLPARDMSAIDLLTLEFCEGPLQISGSVTDGGQVQATIFSTTPSDFLCPLTRQIFNRPTERARHLMAIGGGGLPHLHRLRDGKEEEQRARAAEHLLLCIRAEGSCRNYVAVRVHGESVVRLLQSEVVSARSAAVRLLVELLRLRRRGMVEMFIRGLCTALVTETMDVLLQRLRSSPVEERALVAVLLLYFDRTLSLDEPDRRNSSVYREEAVRILTESLRRCLIDENVVPNTRKALLMLGGHFSFSGDLLAEDRMLEQAGFADDTPSSTPVTSDATVQGWPFLELRGHVQWWCLSNIGGKLDMEEPQRFAEYVSRLALERETEANSNMFQASLKTFLSPSLPGDLEGQIRLVRVCTAMGEELPTHALECVEEAGGGGLGERVGRLRQRRRSHACWLQQLLRVEVERISGFTQGLAEGSEFRGSRALHTSRESERGAIPSDTAELPLRRHATGAPQPLVCTKLRHW